MSAEKFELPDGMVGRFGIVKLWPKIKTAEDENIARLKNTARSLGLECVEVSPQGELLGSDGIFVSKENCDFVIHLHFETPKAYDIYSFVALWNPLKFYHTWGYSRFSKNLLTHDDFISCDSRWADDHVKRLISNDACHQAPRFRMYHSLSEPIFEPKLREFKLFYAGINWERVGKGRSRHQELLDLLDGDDVMKIFGPKIFQGVEVWAGYESYQREIPFDGVSMIGAIAGCGAALVLSSDAHKESELMSNRLFESLAAGALIICDENPFARKNFGDTLLYFNSKDDVARQHAVIVDHINWANQNPDEALELARRAQAIFLEKFALNLSLSDIYRNLHKRKQQVRVAYLPDGTAVRVKAHLMMDSFSAKTIDRLIKNAHVQDYAHVDYTLVVDRVDYQKWQKDIDARLASAGVTIDVEVCDFRQPEAWGGAQSKLGQIMQECLARSLKHNAVVFVAPNEELMSNHFSVLAGSLARNPDDAFRATSVLYKHFNNGDTFTDYNDEVNFGHYQDNRPMGFARFIINVDKIRSDIDCALPYLDKLVFSPFVGKEDVVSCESLASAIILIQDEFPKGSWNSELELGVIGDYSPWVLRKTAETPPDLTYLMENATKKLAPVELSFKNLNKNNKVKLVASLMNAVTPGFVRKPVFWTYDRFAGGKKNA
ncbi:glycosyltransferase [Burkholderia cepacia]|uniref:glycosyltransferase family protein n=1 Tax=Burkholderia cepacia TaxID=292 RepID=UPI00158E63B0|nr:glycosyltransferase [Burkholderia cepacia]MCE4126287.1 glycosyltransferase [Burkholderia cepacia]